MEVFSEVVGQGEPLLFLNGIMMTTTSWALETRVLSRRYRCILHDFRGQLRTPAEGPFTFQQHLDDLVELLDRRGVESAHVVGTSYGGEVGMLFALAHPSRVRTLTVIASVSHVEPPLRDAVTRWRDVALRQPETLYDVTAPFNFSKGFLNDVVMEAGKARLSMCPPHFFSNLADLCDTFLTLDVTGRLHEIQAPTLVVAAELDVLKPVQYSEIIASRVPGARLVVVPGAGHAVVIEKPEAINQLITQFAR